jgi:hypothetical protein
MKEFMLIFRNTGAEGTKYSPEQMQESEKQWNDWMGGIAAAGRFVKCSRPDAEGKTVNGKHMVTDGPYAEIKEILMGVLTVKAESIDDAVEIAKGCPILLADGTVEVRPVMFMKMY